MELESYYIEMRMELVVNTLIQLMVRNSNLATRRRMSGTLNSVLSQQVMKNAEPILVASTSALSKKFMISSVFRMIKLISCSGVTS